MLFTAVQALFYETLFPKCPDMHRPGYTPVAPPVDAQGEYNIPPEDNENGDYRGAPFAPAPPGRFVPPQAPPPRPQPKTKTKAGTLIPQFHKNQPLQGQLLLSWNLMISMLLRHLPQDFLPEIRTPHMDSLILIQALVMSPYMTVRKSLMETLMVVHRIFNTTTGGMEGICLGTGITLPHNVGTILTPPLKSGMEGLAVLILMILFSKNFFNRTKGHIRYHPHLPCQGNYLIQQGTPRGVLAGSISLLFSLIMFTEMRLL